MTDVLTSRGAKDTKEDHVKRWKRTAYYKPMREYACGGFILMCGRTNTILFRL